MSWIVRGIGVVPRMVNRVGIRVSAFGAEVFFKFTPVKQSHVGILPFAEPLQYCGEQDAVDFCRTGDACGERGDVPHGRVGIGESDGFESFLRGFRGEFHLFVVESRVDGQHGR